MLTIIEVIRNDIDLLKSRLNAAIETLLEPNAESGQEPQPGPDAQQDPGQVPVNHPQDEPNAESRQEPQPVSDAQQDLGHVPMNHPQDEPENETAHTAMDTSVVSVDLDNNSEDDLN